MPNLKDIKNRIASIKNTGKITRAMKMVSASKLKRAQLTMTQTRPYVRGIDAMTTSILRGVERESHPLLLKREVNAVEVLVISSDKGLCGAYNTNILKAAASFIEESKKKGLNIGVNTIGKKAKDYFSRRGMSPRYSWTGFSRDVIYGEIEEIGSKIIEDYINGVFDEFYLFYNEFKSVMVQEPSQARVLPMSTDLGSDEGKEAGNDFIYEPSKDTILNRLLPKSVITQIFSAVTEARTSEEAARMVAMENATKNSSEMIDKLTLEYNKARQASITAELMDIVGGAAAIG